MPVILTNGTKNSVVVFAASFALFDFKSLQKLGNLYDTVNVEFNLPEYPNIYVMRDHSTVMLATKSFCNPNKYMFHGNMSDILVEVHRFINGKGKTTGCPSENFRSSVR